MIRKLLFTLTLSIASLLAVAQTFNDGTFRYELYSIGGETVARITSWYSIPSSSEVNIPGYVTYNGTQYRVHEIAITGLSASASSPNTTISTIRVGYGIRRIGNFAFQYLSNLSYVILPSSINYLGYQPFFRTKVGYLAFAGEDVPDVSAGSFTGAADKMYCYTASSKMRDKLKANSVFSNAFTNITKNPAYANDFVAGNTYYTIQNGIPYNYSGSNRSYCTIVGGINPTITLSQNVANTANNAPGRYHVYGVADSAFMNSTTVTKVVNDLSMGEKIGHSAFRNCTNLTSADIAVDTIGAYAFYNCTKLASVTLRNTNDGTPQGVGGIDGYAFGNTAISTVNIPASCNKTMGYAPFYNCQNLKTITVDAGNTAYVAYNNCLYSKSRSWLYQIPCALNNSGTSSTFFAPELTRVLAYAAYGNTMLSSIYLPYGTTTIDSYAFANCTKLTDVHIPSSVNSAQTTSFNNSTSLTNVYLNKKTPPTSNWFFGSNSPSKINLYIPYEGYLTYPTNSGWSTFNLKTGTYDHTRCYDFAYNNLLYTVINTNAVTENGVAYSGECRVVNGGIGSYNIGTYAQVGNKFFKPTEIGPYSFNDGRASVTIDGGSTIKIIHAYAFANIKLTNFPFVNVQKIYSHAFYNTSSLNTSIGFNTPLTSLDEVSEYAFYGSALTGFKAPSTLKILANWSFANTGKLTMIDLGTCANLTSIPDYCFAQRLSDVNGSAIAEAHTAVYLPNSVITIGREAFFNNILTTFNFPSALNTIKYRAFYNSGLPGEVELPYGIKTLEEGALSSYNVTKIVLPATVSSVHSRFFTSTYQSNRLKGIVINTSSPLAFSNDNENINYDYQQLEYKNATIYVPAGQLSTWQNDKHWKTGLNVTEGSYDFTDRNNGFKYTVLSAGTASVAGTCELVYNPETINRSSNVEANAKNYDRYGRTYWTTSIGYKAFMGSTTLNTINISHSQFNNIGDYAFASSSLAKVISSTGTAYSGFESAINPNVKRIGAYAFHSCKNMHELLLPHIDGKNTLTFGSYFFGNNASDFKLWVDYRRLNDFTTLSTIDVNKVYPHLKLDSEWQSFSCVKDLNFNSSNIEAYIGVNYNQIDKVAYLDQVQQLKANTGAVVHGNANDTFYRLGYGSSVPSQTSILEPVSSTQNLNSTSALSYFKLNATAPTFSKVTSSTTFNRGYAYLKFNTSSVNGVTTITTNLGGSGLKGDVNGDGVVNTSDVTTLVNMILGIVAKDITRGDVDGNGEINVSDVTALVNIILK